MMAFSLVASAQTVRWSMQPSDVYSEITRIGENLYKVVKGGKIGLVTAKGDILAEANNDNIVGFYEDKALLTRNDSKGERIVGCITCNGKFNKFSEEYYVLKGLNFYSDGLLPVVNGNGKTGYIDSNGNKKLGFNWDFDRIWVFTEGYATVFKGKKFYLIDKDGEIVKIKFERQGETHAGANIYKGKAYIYAKDGKFYVCDIANGESKWSNYKGKKINVNNKDFLCRFSDISGASKNVPFIAGGVSGKKGVSASQKGNLYGYEKILPNQLQQAGNFEDGYAIVKMLGKWGILEYISGESFAAKASSEVIEYKEGKSVDCSFILSTPSAWKNASVKITDANGNVIPVNGNMFNVTPASSKQEFLLTVEGDGLKLYEAKLEYSFKKIAAPKVEVKKCKYCGKPVKECAYGGTEH